MGVELGSIGTAVGSVASAVGRIGGLVERGAAPLSALPDVGGRLGSISDFKASLPIQTSVFNPLGEIKFTPKIQPELSVPNEVPVVFQQAFADESDFQLAPAENKVIGEPVVADEPAVLLAGIVKPRMEPIVSVPNGLPFIEPKVAISPALEEETEDAVSTKTSTHLRTKNTVSVAPRQAVSTQPVLELQEEQTEVETQIDNQQTTAETQDEEQVNKIKLGLVEDKLKTETREDELAQASDKAITEAQALGIAGVEGWRVVAKLLPQHPGDRSETLNEEDPQNTIPDGSWEAVKADIATRKFTSLEETKRVTSAINRKYRPEKRGEDDDITDEEHQRIHSDHKHSSKRPLQILERKIIKKGRILPWQSAGVNTNPPGSHLDSRPSDPQGWIEGG